MTLDLKIICFGGLFREISGCQKTLRMFQTPSAKVMCRSEEVDLMWTGCLRMTWGPRLVSAAVIHKLGQRRVNPEVEFEKLTVFEGVRSKLVPTTDGGPMVRW